jgi:hypothetical protein
MAFFGTEALRMLREQWQNATLLAQELYAIFTSDQPVTVTSPVAVSGTGNPANPAPVQITLGDNQGITVTHGANTTTFSLDNQGNLQQQTGFAGGSGQKKPIAGGLIGIVQSGSGATYQVALQGTGQVVTVTQLSINASETIPAGTPVVVVQVGAAYQMQVPVWMA